MKQAAARAQIFRFRRSWRMSLMQPPPRVEFNEVPLSPASRMIINIPQLISASAPRGRLCPLHKGTRYVPYRVRANSPWTDGSVGAAGANAVSLHHNRR